MTIRQQNNVPVCFVYVHLGNKVNEQLLSNAENLMLLNPYSQVKLISDQPELWDRFPGEVLEYRKEDRDPRLEGYIERFPEILELNGGYWLRTLERIFALSALSNSLARNARIIHLESDVLFTIETKYLDEFGVWEKTPCLPRLGPLGIASIIIFKQLAELEKFLDSILNSIKFEKEPTTDMKMLGKALKRKDVNILESSPTEFLPSRNERTFLIFDGAAMGQYLFGIDPIHTNGKITSGYRNPYFDFDLSEVKWDIETGDSGASVLYFSTGNKRYLVGSLHIHSKQLIVNPQKRVSTWNNALREANSESARMEKTVSYVAFPVSKLSFKSKLRIFKRLPFKRKIHKILLSLRKL